MQPVSVQPPARSITASDTLVRSVGKQPSSAELSRPYWRPKNVPGSRRCARLDSREVALVSLASFFACLLTTAQPERDYKPDGSYFINQGSDTKDTGLPGWHGTLAVENCPVHQAQIGWQAEQKLREMAKGEDRAEYIKKHCNCNQVA